MTEVVKAVLGCYAVMPHPGLALGTFECLGEDPAAYEMSITMAMSAGFPPLPFYHKQQYFDRVSTVLKVSGVHPAAARNHLMDAILGLSGKDYGSITASNG
jgi:hypothetical protein